MRPVRNSAKAIIIEDGRLLLIERLDSEGVWYLLPGGGQEKNESLVEAVQRECEEELGAQIEVGPLRFIREYIGSHHEFANEDSDLHQVEFMFVCRLKTRPDPEKAHTPDDTQTGWEWVALDELDRGRIYPRVLKAHLTAPEGKAPVYWGDTN